MNPNVAKIKEMWEKGVSKKEIARTFNVTVPTIHYHLNCERIGQKAKESYKNKEGRVTSNRNRKKIEQNLPFFYKVVQFFNRPERYRKRKAPAVSTLPVSQLKTPDIRRAVLLRLSNTRLRKVENRITNRSVKDNKKIYDTVYNNLLTNPVCYLTGRKLDLMNDVWEFDHITPFSRGGSEDISNVGLTSYDANRAKHDKTVDEFLSLCEEVLTHHRYVVVKPT